jgi:hypothetical protein
LGLETKRRDNNMRNYLFYTSRCLRDFLESQKQMIKEEVYKFNEDYILNVSEEDFIIALVNKYTLQPPTIKNESIYTLGSKEIDVDVSQDFLRAIFDRSRPFYIKGTSITIVIPFDGDSNLFYYHPSTYTLNPPRGDVKGNEIHLNYTTVNHNTDRIRSDFEGELNSIQQYLQWVKHDVDVYNNSLEGHIRSVFTQRKQKLLNDRNLVNSLNIPIKKRGDISYTYSIPIQPKRIKIEFPQVKTERFKPEPTLAMEIYEDILNIIENMAIVIERSPKAFSKMSEENLRDHFLVQLNGQYEGQAMGEVFNYQGKTDILVRWENANVFIAECKFWKGEKKLLEAINQLLRYTTWRDTKTAILIFNRGGELSGILKKIPESVKNHPCYKREIKMDNETLCRYILYLPDDSNREIILTILIFNIPTI